MRNPHIPAGGLQGSPRGRGRGVQPQVHEEPDAAGRGVKVRRGRETRGDEDERELGSMIHPRRGKSCAREQHILALCLQPSLLKARFLTFRPKLLKLSEKIVFFSTQVRHCSEQCHDRKQESPHFSDVRGLRLVFLKRLHGTFKSQYSPPPSHLSLCRRSTRSRP